ncbi:uncharacterized protein LOC143366382 [Andrena cerasifolii]|uniref:uncharacterized protein LOC143366382 n=1 Tax=Andrena cerasifolii TaxID=2819439 RepID=UPI0040383ABD
MWDEVPLMLNVQYCAEKDKLVGRKDWGTNHTSKYAEHALVFMLRGIKTGWKTPVTYNFWTAQTTYEQLIHCIKEVVRAVTEADYILSLVKTSIKYPTLPGLLICIYSGSINILKLTGVFINYYAVLTYTSLPICYVHYICHQDNATNTDRIREPKGIKKYWTIFIDNVEFIPLYDAPHLLKCMRTNFLTKDVEIDFYRLRLKDEDRKFAAWDHVITAYKINAS